MIHRMLFTAFVVSLALVVARIFVVPDPSLTYRAFDAGYGVAASFIPSYFVYLLVVYWPRRKDQQTLGLYIANQSALLSGDAQSLLTELEKASGHKSADPPTLQDYQTMCATLQATGQAPMLKQVTPMVYANWLEYLSFQKARSERHADQLLRYMLYMEAEHVRLVTEIRDCVLFMLLGFLPHLPMNTNLSFLAEALFGHYKLTRELVAYCDKHMRGMAWSKPRT